MAACVARLVRVVREHESQLKGLTEHLRKANLQPVEAWDTCRRTAEPDGGREEGRLRPTADLSWIREALAGAPGPQGSDGAAAANGKVENCGDGGPDKARGGTSEMPQVPAFPLLEDAGTACTGIVDSKVSERDTGTGEEANRDGGDCKSREAGGAAASEGVEDPDPFRHAHVEGAMVRLPPPPPRAPPWRPSLRAARVVATEKVGRNGINEELGEAQGTGDQVAEARVECGAVETENVVERNTTDGELVEDRENLIGEAVGEDGDSIGQGIGGRPTASRRCLTSRVSPSCGP